MAITPSVYALFLESLLEGRVNTSADPMWAMMVTAGYVFNQNTHKFKSVVTNELTGSGYTPGGQEVTTDPVAYDSVNKIISIPAGNLVWASTTFVAATGLILYMNPSGFPDDAKPLVSYVDFGGPVSRTDQAFYVNWAATGVLKLAVP